MASVVGLYHEVVGTGPPVLTMHGGMGFDHTLFRPWLDPLGEDHALVYYDHRGNGRSAPPTDWSEVSHATWADDAEALCRQLGLGPVLVLGHSYGSYLAVELALRHPDRVRGLVLVCAAPALDYPDVILANARARSSEPMFERVVELLTVAVPDDASLLAGFRDLCPLYFHRYDRATADALTAELRASADAFNHANSVCLPATDLSPRLSEVAVPTLVVSGRHDWIMPPEHAGARVAHGIPGARHVVMEESGHFPFVEEQEAFLDLVRTWSSGLTTPTPAG